MNDLQPPPPAASRSASGVQTSLDAGERAYTGVAGVAVLAAALASASPSASSVVGAVAIARRGETRTTAALPTARPTAVLIAVAIVFAIEVGFNARVHVLARIQGFQQLKMQLQQARMQNAADASPGSSKT